MDENVVQIVGIFIQASDHTQSSLKTSKARPFSVFHNVQFTEFLEIVSDKLGVSPTRLFYKEKNAEVDVNNDEDLRYFMLNDTQDSDTPLVIFAQGSPKSSTSRPSSASRTRSLFPSSLFPSNIQQQPLSSRSSTSSHYEMMGVGKPRPRSASTSTLSRNSSFNQQQQYQHFNSFSSAASAGLSSPLRRRTSVASCVTTTSVGTGTVYSAATTGVAFTRSHRDYNQLAVHPHNPMTLFAQTVPKRNFLLGFKKPQNPDDVSFGKIFSEETVERLTSSAAAAETKKQRMESETRTKLDSVRKVKKLSKEEMESIIQKQYEAGVLLEKKRKEREDSFYKTEKKVLPQEVIQEFLHRMEVDAWKKSGKPPKQKRELPPVDSIIKSPIRSKSAGPTRARTRSPSPTRKATGIAPSSSPPQPLEKPTTTSQPQKREKGQVFHMDLSLQCLGLGSSVESCLLVLAFNQNGSQKEIGRSEVCKPQEGKAVFSQIIAAPFWFQRTQLVRISVYCNVTEQSSVDLTNIQPIGSAEFVLSDLVTNPSQSISCFLRDRVGSQMPTSVVVHSKERKKEPKTISKEVKFIKVQITGKGFVETSDWKLVIRRPSTGGSLFEVHRTEIVKETDSPSFASFEVPLDDLCLGDVSTVLTFECWKWTTGSESTKFATCKAAVSDILDIERSSSGFPLFNESNGGGGGLGLLQFACESFVKSVSIPQPLSIQDYNFVDYVSSGWELSLTVAIDFTSSNGNPKEPKSLHFIDPSSWNEYESAIQSVGCILQCYDKDKQWPVFGFGGTKPESSNSGEVNHCFPLNQNETKPECYGLQGMMDAYHSAIEQWTLSEPTNFRPVIQKAIECAKSAQSSNAKRYSVLLILTDGEISDMAQTKDAIIQASELPMSIIIVGVGAADFSSMRELDADKKALMGSDGKTASRDCVQFVPLRDFKSRPIDQLAEVTLAEIPTQFSKYVVLRNISPGQ